MKREPPGRAAEAELARLGKQLLLMGSHAESMIGNSIKALVERDNDLANRTIEFDHQINRIEGNIDKRCLRLLADHRLSASQLRGLTVVLRMVTDLEHIGDLGVKICERVVELNLKPALKPYVALPAMSDLVESMLRDALGAFVARDADRVRSVIRRRKTVDAHYAQIFRELLTYVMEDARNIGRATQLLAIAKHLERVGDHAAGIAELVVCMA